MSARDDNRFAWTVIIIINLTGAAMLLYGLIKLLIRLWQ